MKTLQFVAAAVAIGCSATVFAQANSGNTTTGNTSTGLNTANGSINQPMSNTTPGADNSTVSSDSTATPPKKKIHMPKLGAHKTNGTDTNGTPDAPAGNTTGMSGSGPGVPANQNGMGTTAK